MCERAACACACVQGGRTGDPSGTTLTNNGSFIPAKRLTGLSVLQQPHKHREPDRKRTAPRAHTQTHECTDSFGGSSRGQFSLRRDACVCLSVVSQVIWPTAASDTEECESSWLHLRFEGAGQMGKNRVKVCSGGILFKAQTHLKLLAFSFEICSVAHRYGLAAYC